MAEDTICALATPAGGAIGIIRMSGNRAIEIADMVFRSEARREQTADGIFDTKGRFLREARAQSVYYGIIEDTDGEIIDDVLVTVFRAPHSYTGEDSVEISCHGSRYILNRVLRLLVESGCRQAAPGEYTQRAFLNGKMDLSQAEAVADLISATNRVTHRMAMGQLRGNISTELAALRDRLLRMTSLMELELDFSDHEELEFADRTELLCLARTIDSHITRLASTFASGHAVKNGIPVAIVGKTNVGKSTLLNLLSGEDKAIVSDIHGTTRDVIEDTVDINGMTFRFIDTAGMRHTSDKIERMGIERTYRKIDESMIVLWLIDALPEDTEVAGMADLCRDKKLIAINTKVDLHDLTPKLAHILPNTEVIGISAHRKINIDTLCAAIYRLADVPSIGENDVIVTSVRHYESLMRAHEDITRVINGLVTGLSGDLLSEDLRQCLSHLAEITGGQITTNEVLINVFKNFCVGK